MIEVVTGLLKNRCCSFFLQVKSFFSSTLVSLIQCIYGRSDWSVVCSSPTWDATMPCVVRAGDTFVKLGGVTGPGSFLSVHTSVDGSLVSVK